MDIFVGGSLTMWQVKKLNLISKTPKVLVKKNALIIQEDLVLLNILDRLVRSTGYSARSVRTLSELDIEDQETGFDVIISDILFDGIAPLDFVFQLKEIILHEMLLIVTNMGQEKVQAELMASNNVGGFFAVPVDMDELKHFLI